MKKTTMKDIANKAGVSVATVSYVLNNISKEKIAEDTRKKVLKIAKELNYIPNLNARSLVNKKSGMIGIFIGQDYENRSYYSELMYSKLINRMQRLLDIKGYHVLISNEDIKNPKFELVTERQLEGAFFINISEKFFYKVSSEFTVPIIIIDSFIEDLLFHKIITDFNSRILNIKNKLTEEPCLICNKFNDKNMIKRIKESAGKEKDFYLVESKEDLVKFAIKNNKRNFIVTNEFDALVISNYVDSEKIFVIATAGMEEILNSKINAIVVENDKKAKIAVNIMEDYISKNYYDDKCTYI